MDNEKRKQIAAQAIADSPAILGALDPSVRAKVEQWAAEVAARATPLPEGMTEAMQDAMDTGYENAHKRGASESGALHAGREPARIAAVDFLVDDIVKRRQARKEGDRPGCCKAGDECLWWDDHDEAWSISVKPGYGGYGSSERRVVSHCPWCGSKLPE